MTGMPPALHQAPEDFADALGFRHRGSFLPRGPLQLLVLELRHHNGVAVGIGELHLLARARRPIDDRPGAIVLWLYSHDLGALREQLVAAGVSAGAIVDGTPGPRQQMELTDPDGYTVMVAQLEDE